MGPLRGDWGELSQMGLVPCKGTPDRHDPSHHVRTQWGSELSRKQVPSSPASAGNGQWRGTPACSLTATPSMASVPAAGAQGDPSFPIFSRKLKSKGNTVKGKTSLLGVLPRDLRGSQRVREKSEPRKQLTVI